MAKILTVIAWITLSYCLCIEKTLADAAFSNNQKVQIFINYMVKHHHFDRTKLVQLFGHVKTNKSILRFMNKPLEKASWPTYQALFVNEWRIKHGVKFWEQHEETLKKAEAMYGVPASIIVATLGIETKYGEKMGNYRVIDSLSNIAFSSSPRAPFFRYELEQFLLLTREEHLDPLNILGSYAGAIGQPQFMPSSYRRFAVHFVKSDRIDLIHNTENVIGSIANYYHRSGWEKHKPIAEPAKTASSHFDNESHKVAFKKALTLSELHRYGIMPIPSKKNNNPRLKAKVIDLSHHDKNEYWIGFHNFDVIKRYNASNLYAMAVFQLSNDIEKLKGKTKHV